MRLIAGAGASVLVLSWATTSPWSTPPMLGGPLGPGGDSVTSCMAKRDATDMVVGLDVVRNASDEPVTLDRAELVGETGVTLTGARVADVGGDRSLLGHVQGDPPRAMSHEQRLLMRSSRPLTGFMLTPASTGAVDNVLLYLHLEDPGVTAEIEHLRVHYHQGSRHYVWQDNAHFILAAGLGCAAPPS